MNPTTLIQTASVVFLATLAMTVAYLLLTRRINLHGLLHDHNDGRLSPGRIQALLATIYGSASYLMTALTNHGAGALPPVPNELLAIVGGSHSLYLGGKLGSMLQRKFNLNGITRKE